MTVALGVMQLPVTEDADRVRDYLNGTIAGGGLWTALTRSSNHDHTGGNNGTPLSIAAIPDGSITVGKLDPSVLLPYALVDASKPFTGQVTMNADAIVRNTLYFGAKPAGVADVTLARTGAGALRLDTNLGVGVAPVAWVSPYVTTQVGVVALYGQPAAVGVGVRANGYYDGTNNRAIITGASTDVSLANGTFGVYTAPSVAAGAIQTMTQRLGLAQNGTLTLTPAAGQTALIAGGAVQVSGTAGGVSFTSRDTGAAGFLWYAQAGSAYLYDQVKPANRLNINPSGTLTLTPDAGTIAITSGAPGADFVLSNPSSNIKVAPQGAVFSDILDNRSSLGYSSLRWTTVYAVAGAINTSTAEMKQDITPLDPVACAQAVLDTDWVSFSYLPPAYIEPPEQEGQAPEDRQRRVDEGRVAHAQMLVETKPTRDQKGYVLGSPNHGVSDLFGLSDRKSASPSTDLAVVACAVQDVLRRLAVLEGNG